MERLQETLVSNSQGNKDTHLKHISEKLVKEKFTSKNSNLNHWMDNFKKECMRFDLTRDGNKIEILRLFMYRSYMEFYDSMMKNYHETQKEWKSKFSESYFGIRLSIQIIVNLETKDGIQLLMHYY